MTISTVTDLIEYAAHRLALARLAVDARDPVTAHAESEKAAYALMLARRALSS